METERERHQRKHGKHHFFDEIVEPSGAEKQSLLVFSAYVGDMLAVMVDAAFHPLFLITADEVPDGGHGVDGGQLEIPPDEDEQGGKDVACNGQQECHARGRKRSPAHEAVALFGKFAMLEAGQKLPDEKDNQQGREDEVQHRIGYENRAASDDSYSHEDGRQVEPHAVFELLRLQPDEQGGYDGGKQPHEGIGELDGLLVHVVFDKIGGVVENDKNQDASQQGQITSLLLGDGFLDGFDEMENGQENNCGYEPSKQQPGKHEDDDEKQSQILPIGFVQRPYFFNFVQWVSNGACCVGRGGQSGIFFR